MISSEKLWIEIAVKQYPFKQHQIMMEAMTRKRKVRNNCLVIVLNQR